MISNTKLFLQDHEGWGKMRNPIAGSQEDRYGKIWSRRNELEKALIAAEEIGDRQLEGTLLKTLGFVYWARGFVGEDYNQYDQIKQGIMLLEQAWVIACKLKNRKQKYIISENLLIAYRDLGRVGRPVDQRQMLEFREWREWRRRDLDRRGNSLLYRLWHDLRDSFRRNWQEYRSHLLKENPRGTTDEHIPNRGDSEKPGSD